MHANKENINRLLNTAKGQINGIQKMIDNNEYCVDIVNQIMSTIAISKRTNNQLLDANLHHCVLNAKDNNDLEDKMNEISDILRKAMK